MVIYMHKGLFFARVTCPSHSALAPLQIFISGPRLKHLPYLGYASLVAKGKSSDETMWKLLEST